MCIIKVCHFLTKVYRSSAFQKTQKRSFLERWKQRRYGLDHYKSRLVCYEAKEKRSSRPQEAVKTSGQVSVYTAEEKGIKIKNKNTKKTKKKQTEMIMTETEMKGGK